MTVVSEGDNNTFMMMCNDTPHEPVLLQKPDYTPAETVSNSEFDDFDSYVIDGVKMNMFDEDKVSHYHVNMTTMIQLGKWFDYLRENGVYDNTRIILVADHGRATYHFGEMFYNDEIFKCDTLKYNPLFMVKDFDSKGFVTDKSFMMNALTPTFATEGLIENPVNPFTGNLLPDKPLNGKPYILDSEVRDIIENSGTQYIPGTWLTVSDDIYDLDNWKIVENPNN